MPHTTSRSISLSLSTPMTQGWGKHYSGQSILRRAARAVQTPVLGTGPARLGHTLLEGLPRSEHANASVARRNAVRAGERGDRRVVHVNRLERLGVLRLERRRKTRDAGANLSA